MRSPSPTATGFRLIFRRPAIPLAEVAWRWSSGGALWYLGAAFLIEYADSVPVTTVDRLLLGTGQPILIVRAIQRIFRGTAFRFTWAGLVLIIAMTLAWITLAALGRATTLRSLMDEFGIRPVEHGRRKTISSLLALNFLRVAAVLAAVVAGIGAVLFANSLWASTHASPADTARLWLALLFLTWITWAVLNWLLSTASIFAVTEGSRAFMAIASTVDLCLRRPGTVAAIAIWFGFAHAGALAMACGIGVSVLEMFQLLGPGAVLFLECGIALLYCAVADFLYIGRLAAYLEIIRSEQMLDLRRANEMPPGHLTYERFPVDQGELILSDVPLPAT